MTPEQISDKIANKNKKCSKMTCQKYKCKDTAAEVRVFLPRKLTPYTVLNHQTLEDTPSIKWKMWLPLGEYHGFEPTLYVLYTMGTHNLHF